MFYKIITIFLFLILTSQGALASTCDLDAPVICYGLTSIGRGAFSFVEYQQHGIHKNIIKVLKLSPTGEVMVTYNIYERSIRKIRQLITDVSYNVYPKDPLVKRLIKQRRNRNLRKLINSAFNRWVREYVKPLEIRGFATQFLGWLWL